VEAIAFASGSTGSASAWAETSSGIVANLSLQADAPSHPLVTTNARGSVGGTFSSSLAGVTAHGVALPQASDVTNNLAGDPNVAAAYDSLDGETPLALVALALNPPGLAPTHSATYSASASLSFDVATLQSGKLLVGLLDPTSSGPDFSSLHFSIAREGTIVEDQTFATMAAATTYFNDNPLDLGPLKLGVTGTLDITFLLEMTTLDNGARYNASFLVADVGLVSVTNPLGDYNDDGAVDAADYVMWRKASDAGLADLPNDNDDPGNVGPTEYALWRTNFGQTAGAGSGAYLAPGDSPGAKSAVPEPNAATLCLIGASLLIRRRPR
jgi:hypothetical protein